MHSSRGYGKIYQYQEQQTSRRKRKEGTKKWAGVQMNLRQDLIWPRKQDAHQILATGSISQKFDEKTIKFN